MIVAFLLILVALGVALFSMLAVSQATQGVWLIGAACFLAILARIAQADAHQRKLLEAMSPPPPKE